MRHEAGRGWNGPHPDGMGGPEVRRGRRTCILATYVDGIPRPSYAINDIPFDDLDGIEVHHGNTIPAHYAGNRCGVVLIWTRR